MLYSLFKKKKRKKKKLVARNRNQISQPVLHPLLVAARKAII